MEHPKRVELWGLLDDTAQLTPPNAVSELTGHYNNAISSNQNPGNETKVFSESVSGS